MNVLLLDAVWIILLAGTGITWWIGESGGAGAGATVAVMGIAGVKGVLVIREFMALRGVRFLWQALVIGWLALVLTIILATYPQGA